MVLIGRRKQLRSLQRAGRADAEGGKGERVWKNATRMLTVFGSVFKKIILIDNNNNLKKILLRCVSGGCWFGRSHFRGQHAAFLKTRSRAEWLTAAFEVPSFPASNHWEAGWMERQREGGTGRE